MSERFNLLSQQLLQKDISDCSVDELQQLSQQYPFFAPAHLLLLQKLKEENSPEYAQHVQRVALYHHNPLAFDYLINRGEYTNSFPSEVIVAPPETSEEEIPLFNPLSLPVETTEIEEPQETGEIEDVELRDQPSEETTEPKEEEETKEIQDPASDAPAIPVIETGNFDLMEVREVEKLEPIIDIEPGQDPDAEETTEPENEPKAALAFEPYHTVDYFASVGIKLSREEAAKDNFGRQLKSFTEWLKTMKRLPAAEQIKKLDPHAEEKVENIAAHSLDNAEVLTETMAEVWVKQGKLEKAIEVYNKLSLQNPSKRAYFAAKLENLKKAI